MTMIILFMSLFQNALIRFSFARPKSKTSLALLYQSYDTAKPHAAQQKELKIFISKRFHNVPSLHFPYAPLRD
jgi:hypothetical protein